MKAKVVPAMEFLQLQRAFYDLEIVEHAPGKRNVSMR